MPNYDYACGKCGERFTVSKPMDEAGEPENCPTCEIEARRIFSIQGLRGVSDGPGSCCNELIFDRPNPKKDIPLTLRKMADAGKLKDPDTLRMAQIKMKVAQSMPESTVDYQKKGHPLDV